MGVQVIAVMAVVVVTVPVVIAAAVIAVTWVVARVNSSVKIAVHVWLIQPSVLNAMRCVHGGLPGGGRARSARF